MGNQPFFMGEARLERNLNACVHALLDKAYALIRALESLEQTANGETNYELWLQGLSHVPAHTRALIADFKRQRRMYASSLSAQASHHEHAEACLQALIEKGQERKADDAAFMQALTDAPGEKTPYELEQDSGWVWESWIKPWLQQMNQCREDYLAACRDEAPHAERLALAKDALTEKARQVRQNMDEFVAPREKTFLEAIFNFPGRATELELELEKVSDLSDEMTQTLSDMQALRQNYRKAYHVLESYKRNEYPERYALLDWQHKSAWQKAQYYALETLKYTAIAAGVVLGLSISFGVIGPGYTLLSIVLGAVAYFGGIYLYDKYGPEPENICDIPMPKDPRVQSDEDVAVSESASMTI